MAQLHIPSALRELTGGQSRVEVDAATAGEAVDRLDARHPGIKARLLEGGRLRPGLALYLDGAEVATGLRTRLTATSKLHFLAAQSGG
jgi:sulfur-carrier protein